ncbi:MAG: helix-hairpin-helix domain-containing protein [Chitinophagaceae bacterium]|nr:helix-hairpin-helix domain-containing protein [Chitinophagaceae bacterium]
MRWKWLLQEYFVFSRKERLAILTLIFLLLLAIVMPYYCARPAAQWQADADTAWMTAMTILESRKARHDSTVPSFVKDRKSALPARDNSLRNLTGFDPNTHSEAGWLSFGLSAKTVGTIMKFRQKGGRFRAPEDLRRIYGLHPDQAEQLIPYVRIAEAVSASARKYPENSSSATHLTPSPLLDINQADSTAWEALPGIGPKLASRIIKFREGLGGFYQVSQLAEVFGLADSVYQRILPRLKCSIPEIQRLSVNTSTEAELARHPYIKRTLATQIVAYRNIHGAFRNIEQLINIHGIDSTLYKKILPYLTL